MIFYINFNYIFNFIFYELKVESGNIEHSITGAPDTIESKAEVHHLPRPDPTIDATDLSDTTESEAEKHACKS